MTSNDSLAAPVAIIGGGPVGLMLAMNLDFFGVRSVLINTDPTTRWLPKGPTHNARTLEHFRRLGISKQVRALGLPPTIRSAMSRAHVPGAARRICGCMATCRCSIGWAAISPCCGSTRNATFVRSKRPPPRAACRSTSSMSLCRKAAICTSATLR